MSDLTSKQTRLIVIMGVSGTGKSTLAENVAQRCQAVFVDADDFHSTQAKQMMSDGIPLTDDIRDQWILRLNAHIHTLLKNQQQCVVAYSGLISRQRKAVATCCGTSLSFLLDVSFDTLEKRLINRINAKQHFFNPALLQSQFDSFNPIGKDENITVLDGELSLDILVNQVLDSVNKA